MNASDFPPQRARVPVLRCGGNRLKLAAILGCCASRSAACASLNSPSEALRFSAPEGAVLNEFYLERAPSRRRCSAHGREPDAAHRRSLSRWEQRRGSWFEGPRPERSPGGHGREDGERGADARGGRRRCLAWRDVRDNDSDGRGPLRVRQAIASSVRVIRNYQDAGKIQPEVAAAPERIRTHDRMAAAASGRRGGISPVDRDAARRRRSGDPRKIELVGKMRMGGMKMRITALTGDEPLTPLDENELLNQFGCARRSRCGNALAFLSYEEKLLAGSWRFNTYFGRDTLCRCGCWRRR